MQDELLIKFIDGRCSQEEAQEVIRELSLEGDDSREWLQMQTAASLAGTGPFEAVRTEDARRFVSEVIAKEKIVPARRKVLKWSGIAAGICAVAASLAIILTVGSKGNDNGFPGEGDRLAFAGDSLSQTSGRPEQPGRLGQLEQSEQNTSGAETGSKEMPSSGGLPQSQPNGAPAETSDRHPQSVPSVSYDRNASRNDAPGASSTPGTSATPGASAASGTSTAPGASTTPGTPATPSDKAPSEAPSSERTLKMTRPSKSPYKVKVKDLSKDFVFEWDAPGALRAALVVKDRDGMILVDRKIEELTETRIPVSVMAMTDRGELFWRLVLEYPDGGTLSRTGRLELKSVID